jgi:hypothetical protein
MEVALVDASGLGCESGENAAHIEAGSERDDRRGGKRSGYEYIGIGKGRCGQRAAGVPRAPRRSEELQVRHLAFLWRGLLH